MGGNRRLWYKDHGLDLVQSVTLPSAAFRAMWKKTKARHKLIIAEHGGQRLMDELTEIISIGKCLTIANYVSLNFAM